MNNNARNIAKAKIKEFDSKNLGYLDFKELHKQFKKDLLNAKTEEDKIIAKELETYTFCRKSVLNIFRKRAIKSAKRVKLANDTVLN